MESQLWSKKLKDAEGTQGVSPGSVTPSQWELISSLCPLFLALW